MRTRTFAVALAVLSVVAGATSAQAQFGGPVGGAMMGGGGMPMGGWGWGWGWGLMGAGSTAAGSANRPTSICGE
jgi:hypothetical protein